MCFWKEVPLGIHTEIIFMIAEVEDVFPIYVLQGSTISRVNLVKSVNISERELDNLF
jgi:hypothetical protein